MRLVRPCPQWRDMSTLPLRLEPAPDESWPSYLTRRAEQHHCTVAVLADHIGLRSGGRWPGHYGVRIDSDAVDRVSGPLGLGEGAVRRMQLDSYDQLAFDLTGLMVPGTIASIRAVAARNWVHLAGSNFCPQCLQDQGVWRLRWRLPWATTCPTHKVFLVSRCTACGQVPQIGNKLRGSAPARADAIPNGRLCTYPFSTGVCGNDLSQMPTVAAPSAAVQRDARFEEMFRSDRGSVAGGQWTSLQTVRAWQSSIGLALHLRATEVDGWGTYRGMEPPREPQTMHGLLDAVSSVVEAPDIESAARVLSIWLTEAGIPSPHADTFTRTTAPSAGLRPVIDNVLAQHGRVHTRIRRLSDLDGQERLAMHDWEIDDIPQMVWPCALPADLRDNSRPDHRFLRVVVAMILIRMQRTRTWVDAGAGLGIPSDKARNWTRYAFAEGFGLRQGLIRAANELSPHLTGQRQRHVWAERPLIQGHGIYSLADAQQPGCGRESRDGNWCPCRASTQGADRARQTTRTE